MEYHTVKSLGIRLGFLYIDIHYKRVINFELHLPKFNLVGFLLNMKLTYELSTQCQILNQEQVKKVNIFHLKGSGRLLRDDKSKKDIFNSPITILVRKSLSNFVSVTKSK